jgi:hypothetical protein
MARTGDVLRDLWTAGDDALREDVAVAWASPSIWAAGGREALRVVIAAEHGPGAVEGAAAVLHRPDADAETARAAIGQLVRAIDAGSRTARLHAIAVAPLDRADLRDAVRRASTDDDDDVRVGALARLAILHEPVLGPLEALGQPGEPTAQRARFALANAGDRRVQAWLEADLASPAPEERVGAATALSVLGVSARAAPLLADADPSVRVRSACAILMAARVR